MGQDAIWKWMENSVGFMKPVMLIQLSYAKPIGRQEQLRA